MANDSRQHRDADYVAGVAAAIALGFLIGVQAVSPSNAESAVDIHGTSNWSADYFPAQFTVKPAADESDEQIPTF
jgi:hypothetical protein